MEPTGRGVAAEAAVWIVPAPASRLDEAARLAGQAWDVPPPRGHLERVLREPGSITLVALDPARPDGPIAGVMTARILSAHLAVSDETVVAPRWRGRGVGAMLVAHMREVLRAAGVRELRGHSSRTKEPELRFFMRQGFRVIDQRVANGLDWIADGETYYETALLL